MAAGDKPAPAKPLQRATVEPSPLIYPAETIPLKFDHAQHAKLGATCEGCHLSAQTSTSAADNLIPREAACRSCHKIDRAQPDKAVPKGVAAARCDACHVDMSGNLWMPGGDRPADPPRVVLARPNLKFNHQLHGARGIACTACHVDAGTQAMVTRADLPMMASCLACHDGKQATARCTACHLAEPDGRVKTKLRERGHAGRGGQRAAAAVGIASRLDAHGPTFRRDHAVGRARGELLPELPQAQRLHRLPWRRRQAARHPPRRLCVDARAGCAPQRSRLLGLPPRAVVLRRLPPALGRCGRPRGGDPRPATPEPVWHRHRAQAVSTRRGGRATRPARCSPMPRARAIRWPPSATSAPVSPATARTAASPAIRPTRPAGPCSRRTGRFCCHGALSVPVGRNRRACLKCHAPGTAQLDCEL